jgi:hypothetical protein
MLKKSRLLTRQGWAGEKSDFFMILLIFRCSPSPTSGM